MTLNLNCLNVFTMKNLMLTLVLLSISAMVFSQSYDFSVSESEITIGGTQHNTLVISIYECDKKDVIQAWKDELKNLGGKVTVKKEISATECHKADLSSQSFNIISKIEENGDVFCKLYVAIDYAGTYVNSKDLASEFGIFSTYLKKFAMNTTKEGIMTQAKEAEKELEKQNDELEKLKKEKEKLENDIVKWKEDIEKAENKIVENSEDQVAKKTDIVEAEQKVKTIKSKLDKIK